MATRSMIGLVHNDGHVTGNAIITGIYCHWDGYPSGVGKTLLENYTTKKDVKALLELGDISTLGDTLETTVAYARDRGENYNDVKARTYYGPNTFNTEEYAYLFYPGVGWKVSPYGKPFITLTAEAVNSD